MKRKNNVQEISRKDAADLISELISATDPSDPSTHFMVDLFRKYNLALPRACSGEAHSNPFIDHCSMCMPHWGYIHDPVKVK